MVPLRLSLKNSRLHRSFSKEEISAVFQLMMHGHNEELAQQLPHADDNSTDSSCNIHADKPKDIVAPRVPTPPQAKQGIAQVPSFLEIQPNARRIQ